MTSTFETDYRFVAIDQAERPLTDHSNDVFEPASFTAVENEDLWTLDLDGPARPFRDLAPVHEDCNSETSTSMETTPNNTNVLAEEHTITRVRPPSTSSDYCSILSFRTSIQTFETARSQRSVVGLREALASHLNELR